MLDRGQRPVGVPSEANHAGETKQNEQQGSWVEPTIWTERMLAALEQGVKGGKWYSLIDKIYSEDTLHAAFSKVSANKGSAGVDHVTVEQFATDLDANLKRLRDSLRDGTYQPQAIRRHYIPKAGSKQEMRPLGIPISTRWTISWLARDSRWSVMRTTSWSCVGPPKKQARPWPSCSNGPPPRD